MGPDKAFIAFVTFVVGALLVFVIFFTNIIPPDGKCLIGYILGGLAVILLVRQYFK